MNWRVGLTIAYTFDSSDPNTPHSKEPEGLPGAYDIRFALSNPGKDSFRDSIDPDAFLASGHSNVIIPANIGDLKATLYDDNGENVEIIIYHDQEGALTQARLRLEAQSFDDAEHVAYDLVMPLLSSWSYHLDVALDVAGYKITEETTQSFRIVLGVVGKAKSFSPPPYQSTPEFRTLFASYREAMNATNVFHQFLCFFKVIEGSYNLRAVRKGKALALGKPYTDPPNEQIPQTLRDLGIPEDPHEEYFSPYLGKKFTAVRDDLRSLIRNALAHCDPTGSSGDPLLADRFEDVRRCTLAILVTKFIARTLLDDEIHAAGIIGTQPLPSRVKT